MSNKFKKKYLNPLDSMTRRSETIKFEQILYLHVLQLVKTSQNTKEIVILDLITAGYLNFSPPVFTDTIFWLQI